MDKNELTEKASWRVPKKRAVRTPIDNPAFRTLDAISII